MKKIASLLLVLALLLSLAACQAAGDFRQMQTEPSDRIQTDGTTEPLFWPPLPVETEETTEPTQAETVPDEQQDQPAATWPAPKPAEDPTDATYIPRDDEAIQPTRGEEIERPEDTEPINQPDEPDVNEPDEPVQTQPTQPPAPRPTEPAGTLDPDGIYDSKDDVALYIHLYGRLPNNYITKSRAEALGWSGNGNDPVPSGKCIGGDRFYNREGLLPKGHTYYECDIGTLGARSRGTRRIVYSTDGLIYYTSNHYQSFTLLYEGP